MKHLYWGDGKGKTTAAMGMALRALAAGQKVVIVQFLKSSVSGEIEELVKLGAVIYRGKSGHSFVSDMTDSEKAETKALQTENLKKALSEKADLLILDEACAAWNYDMVDRELLREAVENTADTREIILTGRAPAEWMRTAADYETEMRCHKHPYINGVMARKGVEF